MVGKKSNAYLHSFRLMYVPDPNSVEVEKKSINVMRFGKYSDERSSKSEMNPILVRLVR